MSYDATNVIITDFRRRRCVSAKHGFQA